MQMKQVFSTYRGKEDGSLGQFKYCPCCGTQLALKEQGAGTRPACPGCGFVHYRNPVPGVVVLIDQEGCVLLAGVVSGELGARDDLETVEWFPLAEPLPEMAFEADAYIIERYRQTTPEWGLPVDPDLGGGGNPG